MLLSVIIVSYNTQELTLQTINSVIESTKNSQLLKDRLEIIVIDNNSADDSVSALKTLKSKITVPLTIIENTRNDGFAKANNLGVEKAHGRYIIFLNSDTVVQNQALENMITRFQDNGKLGILAPALLNPDFTYQPQGGSRPTLFTLFVHMTFLDDIPLIGQFLPSTQQTGKANKLTTDYLDTQTNLISMDWVGGTAMMVSRKALDTFGALDPNIFMYAEDIEICMRAQNHHYKVAIDPTARIIHLQNASSNSENAVRGEFRGYVYIFAKHYSSVQTALAKIILQLGAILRIFLFSTLSNNPKKVALYKSLLSDLD